MESSDDSETVKTKPESETAAVVEVIGEGEDDNYEIGENDEEKEEDSEKKEKPKKRDKKGSESDLGWEYSQMIGIR